MFFDENSYLNKYALTIAWGAVGWVFAWLGITWLISLCMKKDAVVFLKLIPLKKNVPTFFGSPIVDLNQLEDEVARRAAKKRYLKVAIGFLVGGLISILISACLQNIYANLTAVIIFVGAAILGYRVPTKKK